MYLELSSRLTLRASCSIVSSASISMDLTDSCRYMVKILKQQPIKNGVYNTLAICFLTPTPHPPPHTHTEHMWSTFCNEHRLMMLMFTSSEESTHTHKRLGDTGHPYKAVYSSGSSPENEELPVRIREGSIGGGTWWWTASSGTHSGWETTSSGAHSGWGTTSSSTHSGWGATSSGAHSGWGATSSGAHSGWGATSSGAHPGEELPAAAPTLDEELPVVAGENEEELPSPVSFLPPISLLHLYSHTKQDNPIVMCSLHSSLINGICSWCIVAKSCSSSHDTQLHWKLTAPKRILKTVARQSAYYHRVGSMARR